MCRETIKMWKMRNVQCSTWNMATNLKKSGKLNLDYGEIKDNRGKWDTNNAWPKIWRETLKKREKWEMHTVWAELWQENWPTRKMRHSHAKTWNMARNT